jgi:hypothetical protein
MNLVIAVHPSPAPATRPLPYRRARRRQVSLSPGEALFLGPNLPHAYLAGLRPPPSALNHDS